MFFFFLKKIHFKTLLFLSTSNSFANLFFTIDNLTDPPVPPRRTKRKNKRTAPIASTEVTNDDARSRQKRPLQPPLPTKKCQRNKSRSIVEDLRSRCDIAASCSKVENVKNHDVDIGTDMIEPNSPPRSRNDDTISATREIPPRIGKANDDTIPEKSIALKPLLPSLKLASSKRNTLEKYPPLFFTLHDFEDVMSGDRDKKIFAPSTASLEKKSSTAQILDDDDDICFRVTTTNLPFEKCLESWRGSFDNEFTEKFDNYQFNNENESDRTNVERLSNRDDFEHRTGTKVRFVIDSQNPSKRNDNGNVKINVPCDSLQCCESIFDDEKASEQSVDAPFVKLTEIREEFRDVKDSGDNLRDKSCASSAEKRNPATREDPFMPTDTNKLDMKLKTIPQSHYDDINDRKIHKEDSNFISRNEPVSNENLGNENITTKITKKKIIMSDKQIDQSETLEASSEIAKSARHFIDKSLEVCSNEEANVAKITRKNTHREEEIFWKKADDNIKEKCIVKNKEIFVNESLPSFLNNRDNDKSNILTNDFTNEFEIEETRGSPTKKYKEKNNFVDSKYNREEASPSQEIFTKSVPVKIRRNSFLETMLSDDSTDTSTNYAITTKTNLVSPTNMNEKLNTPNESTNKVREPDITNKIEYVCDSYNKTIKVDTENHKDFKIKKKIVKVSNTDVKSMQSENKNACDVKNDVLNELLCNFNNIKLKIVSPENKKPAMKIEGEDDKNIARSIATDNRIFKKNSTSLEISESGVCDISISAKIIDVNNDMTIVEKTGKEDLTEINVEGRLQDLRNSARNPTIDKKIIEKKDIEVTKFNESCNIKIKTVKDDSVKKTIDENNSNIKSKEICVKMKKIEERSDVIKNVDEVKRESKKLRDIRAPKTILKNKSIECEQQRMIKFQNRIPIGAPATMNKIFDSREFEAIAIASRSLEKNQRKRLTSKQIRSHGEEKTDDEIIAASEADVGRRRVANRSTLALLDDTKGSDDKCAIARKTTSIIPCNNNDNNRAVTPVVNISNDQSSRDVVTITPGKVRSFIKYYEIRGDATTVERHSKINDREKVAKRKSTKSQAPPVAAGNSQPEVITEREETKNEGRSVKSNSRLETSSNEIQFSKIVAKIPKNSADDSIRKTARAETKVTKGHEKNDSNVIDRKTCTPLAKTGAKKSVQFLGGFTVIHSETFDENESAGIVTDCDANALKKRRAPGIPPSRDSDGCQELVREFKKSEKLPDAEKSSFQRQEAVAQMHAVISHGENSGINCFV